jgi:hypothetical protein
MRSARYAAEPASARRTAAADPAVRAAVAPVGGAFQCHAATLFAGDPIPLCVPPLYDARRPRVPANDVLIVALRSGFAVRSAAMRSLAAQGAAAVPALHGDLEAAHAEPRAAEAPS